MPCESDLILKIRKINTDIFMSLNKFYSNEELKSNIRGKLLIIDNILSTSVDKNQLELVYILHWSILNLIIGYHLKKDVEEIWKNNGTIIHTTKYRFVSSPESGRIFFDLDIYKKNGGASGKSIEYNKFFKCSYNHDDTDWLKKIERKIEGNSISEIIQIYLLSHNENHIIYILERIRMLRNNLTLTHNYKFILTLSDCLVHAAFILYIFKMPYNVIKYKVDLNNAELKDYSSKMNGVIEKKKRRKSKYYVLFKYTKKPFFKEPNDGQLFVKIKVDEYKSININDHVNLTFRVSTKKSADKYFNNIEGEKIIKTQILEELNYNYRVQGIVNDKYMIGDYSYILLQNNNFEYAIKISTKQEYDCCSIGDRVELSVYFIAEENKKTKMYVNNIVSNKNSLVFLKNDLTFEHVMKSLYKVL